jgi:hypothetical protein
MASAILNLMSGDCRVHPSKLRWPSDRDSTASYRSLKARLGLLAPEAVRQVKVPAIEKMSRALSWGSQKQGGELLEPFLGALNLFNGTAIACFARSPPFCCVMGLPCQR